MYETSSDSELTARISWIFYIERKELAFSEMLDPLTIYRLPVLIDVSHEEASEMLLYRSANSINRYPFSDRSRLDVAKVFKRHLLYANQHGSNEFESTHILLLCIILVHPFIVLPPPSSRVDPAQQAIAITIRLFIVTLQESWHMIPPSCSSTGQTTISPFHGSLRCESIGSG